MRVMHSIHLFIEIATTSSGAMQPEIVLLLTENRLSFQISLIIPCYNYLDKLEFYIEVIEVAVQLISEINDAIEVSYED